MAIGEGGLNKYPIIITPMDFLERREKFGL